MLALLDVFLPQGGGALGVFDLALRLLFCFAFLPFKVLAQRADFLVQLLLAFLDHRGDFLAFAFELLDLLHGVLVWHERLDRYKFPEFGVLDVVLAILVEVFLVQILQEGVLSLARLFYHVAVIIGRSFHSSPARCLSRPGCRQRRTGVLR